MRRLIACAFAVLGSASSIMADGLILDGLGARSAGRGGTNLAFADSGTILHDNPGGIVNFEGCSLTQCDAELLIVDSEYQDAGRTSRYHSNPVPMGNFSILKKLDQNVAVGLGVFTTGGFATDRNMEGPLPFVGDRKYKSFGAYGKVLPGISAKLTDSLSVGATLGVGIDHTELEGPYTLQSSPLSGTATLMDLQGTGAALTWSVGLQYQLTPCTTIGASYKSESRFSLDGNVSTVIPGLGESAFDADIDIVWPREVGAGIRHQFTPTKTGAIDVLFINWQNAYDYAGMTLTNPTNPAFGAFGTINEQFPLLWQNSVSARFGFENQISDCRTIRFGYVYHRNPIPTETLTPYLVPILEHTVSIGWGTKTRQFEIDYGYQFMFGDTETVGTSNLVGVLGGPSEFENSEFRTQAHLLFVSFQRRQ